MFLYFDVPSLKHFCKNKIIAINFVVTGIITCGNLLFLYFKSPRGEDQTSLHYNVFFGIDFLDDPIKIFNIILFSVFIVFINFLLAYILYSKERLISYFLVNMATIITIFLLAHSFLIIKINS